ncbi:MAG: DUF459 domain-containing protein [Alphaproteobacteria bacterium]|jgi:hypothetical protein|nr:DUF459 domain-containing protein [Alphaproteobacteria bacterium]
MTQHPDRRLVLAWLSVTAMAGGFVGSRAHTARAAGMLRILVVGDSLANQIGWGLTQVLSGDARFDVVNRGRASTGLVRDDFYDWPAHLAQLLAAQRFDAVVVSVGMNDRQNIALPGTILPRFSDAWRAAYAERVDRMMALIDEAGVPGFWMGMPIARSAAFSRGMSVINEVFESVAARRANIAYVPMWDMTADANGAYTPYGRTPDGQSGVIRTQDGMHLTGFGSRLVAAYLIREMDTVLEVATSP